jgi:hypothetical protein
MSPGHKRSVVLKVPLSFADGRRKTNDVQTSSTNSPTHMREIRYLFMYIDESFLRFQRHVEYNASII